MSENGQDALRSFIKDLYASYGDPERFDAHLDPGITIWESDQTDMLVGVEALDGLRGGRNGETPAPPTVRPVPRGFVVDVYGDTGVVRYDLGVEQLTGEPTGDLFRVTDVLRSSDGHWRIVHHHAEQVAP